MRRYIRYSYVCIPLCAQMSVYVYFIGIMRDLIEHLYILFYSSSSSSSSFPLLLSTIDVIALQ